jgi:hypothetical protein
LEMRIMELLEVSSNIFKSNLNNDTDPKLLTRIPIRYGKTETSVQCTSDPLMTIYDIKRNMRAKFTIMLRNTWTSTVNNNHGYIMYVKKVCV